MGDIQRQSAILKREERAIVYPPPEFFRTIKSVENNCKEQRKKDKDLRYMVTLGLDNIELWTKHLREPQYTQQRLTVFGEIEEPNIQRIITTPNIGQSPPKGRGKPYNYSTLQQQTTPQRIEQEKINETESAQNIPQGEIEAASSYNTLRGTTGETGNEETFNQNIIQRMNDEVENETTLNPNILQEIITPNTDIFQGIITPNTDIFQGIINDVENEININQNI